MTIDAMFESNSATLALEKKGSRGLIFLQQCFKQQMRPLHTSGYTLQLRILAFLRNWYFVTEICQNTGMS
jgi:hypothetical protein